MNRLVTCSVALAMAVAACKGKDEASDKRPAKANVIASAAESDAAADPSKPKHTLQQLTSMLDAMQKKRDFDGLFRYMSRAHRATTSKQVKAILAKMKPQDVKSALGITKEAANKLSAKDLLARLMRLPELRGLYAGNPHTFVRADFETKLRANVLTTQDGVHCRRRFVLEDGDWRLDKGAVCEEAKLTDVDDKLFKQLLVFMRTLVTAAEKNKASCNKVAAAWVGVLAKQPELVKQRKLLMRNPPRYKLFSRLHAKQNAALTRRLLPILKKCARNPSMRRALSKLM